MKLLTKITVFIVFLTACSQTTPIEPRSIFQLDRVYINEYQVDISETNYLGSTLTFVGPENGGNILIKIGETVAQASINPSREHPSFQAGYWHHHLYSLSTAQGSPRINFIELFPELGIDDIENSIDNTQSSYQRGNLHYIVASEEFRLRFIIEGEIHDLIFIEK